MPDLGCSTDSYSSSSHSDSIHKPVIGQTVDDDDDGGDDTKKKPNTGKSPLRKDTSHSEADDDEDEPTTKQARNEGNKEVMMKKTSLHKSPSSYVFKSGITPNLMTGHTGYLTFATLFPE